MQEEVERLKALGLKPYILQQVEKDFALQIAVVDTDGIPNTLDAPTGVTRSTEKESFSNTKSLILE